LWMADRHGAGAMERPTAGFPQTRGCSVSGAFSDGPETQFKQASDI
jgi:hypothetical protein